MLRHFVVYLTHRMLTAESLVEPVNFQCLLFFPQLTEYGFVTVTLGSRFSEAQRRKCGVLLGGTADGGCLIGWSRALLGNVEIHAARIIFSSTLGKPWGYKGKEAEEEAQRLYHARPPRLRLASERLFCAVSSEETSIKWTSLSTWRMQAQYTKGVQWISLLIKIVMDWGDVCW